MKRIEWRQEVDERKEQLIADTQRLLAIRSVLEEDEEGTPEAPFGKGIQEALEFMLDLGEKDGFTVKNIDNYAAHIEMGEGEEIVGILCHLDVVPEGDGWTSDPYAAEIRDGKMYARGAIDDKGPTMTAYYAMKMIKELDLPLKKRVRMILGTDEETQWRCVERYFEKEEMPVLGFAPDADFPIIYAEKGIWDLHLTQELQKPEEDSALDVLEFSSGRRLNMVPDYAVAKVQVQDIKGFKEQFSTFLQKHELKGKAEEGADSLVLEIEGLSAHGAEPENGVNAGLFLSAFLGGKDLPKQAKDYFMFIHDHFFGDSRGRKLGLDFSDEITGDLTINVGTMKYTKEKGGKIGLNLRYPVTYEYEKGKNLLEAAGKGHGFQSKTISHNAAHHVEESSFLIQTLKKVYEEETGEEAKLLAIGGGTYARSLTQGVAFGPLFPGKEERAHQFDEYIEIDDMLKAAVIYAKAIYELAK
ncbi:dipeptidase PepV [Peribacillus deserti]|uniref:Dipeptidase PepV n=1 Tax=Peribacillus deserti TaxID=673318 RepID=A0A2N5M4N7_9BACI|nr:dipeptidase PepV [Peribacillus deserti]PLT29233.1 dipeptidase PepV [Peribacillus deserti]